MVIVNVYLNILIYGIAIMCLHLLLIIVFMGCMRLVAAESPNQDTTSSTAITAIEMPETPAWLANNSTPVDSENRLARAARHLLKKGLATFRFSETGQLKFSGDRIKLSAGDKLKLNISSRPFRSGSPTEITLSYSF